MKFSLKETTLKKIVNVLRSFPAAEEAVIYGSRALGTCREGSDIDLTLEGDLGYQDLLKIEMELDVKMMPYTFDLSLYSRLENDELREHIGRAGKSFYIRTSAVRN